MNARKPSTATPATSNTGINQGWLPVVSQKGIDANFREFFLAGPGHMKFHFFLHYEAARHDGLCFIGRQIEHFREGAGSRVGFESGQFVPA